MKLIDGDMVLRGAAGVGSEQRRSSACGNDPVMVIELEYESRRQMKKNDRKGGDMEQPGDHWINIPLLWGRRNA